MSNSEVHIHNRPDMGDFQVKQRRIIFLLRPDLSLLDLAGPVQVFDTAIRVGAPYQLVFCASQNMIPSGQGLVFAQLVPPPPVSKDDLVIIPGTMSVHNPGDLVLSVEIQDWLRQAHQVGAHIASVCSGSFVLGEIGLLNGRRCTTHWLATPFLKQCYPEAQVLDTALYIHDGQITTSAGVVAGIDMAFSFLEQYHGALFTAQIARYLVVYLRRNGTHSQSSIYLEYRTHLHAGVHQAQDYLISRATEHVSLDDLATVAGISTRSLNRAFKEATGLTPIQYQQRLRLELATNLVHDPNLSIEQVAAKCGFVDARHFRRLWQRYFGTSPSITRSKVSRVRSE
jgi:transcriptional regulator GlxA family with amidase domain